MRIHRTTPTRSFSVFSNSLLRDRSLSWTAVGVLTYLLSLPNGARATIRTLAEQRKEGRARISSALRELEESRYLRRVVRKDHESGQLSTVYEVFDTPYDDEPPPGETEKVRNLASGVSDSAASGPLPSGEKTGGQEPPSPAAAPAPASSARVESEPVGPVSQRTALAARLLGSLRRSDARLGLGVADALRLAPLVEEWWELGATNSDVRAALTQGLPRAVYSPAALVADRLRRKRPGGAPAVKAAAESPATASPAPSPAPVTTVAVEIRKPGATAYRAAAQRGGALARALLRGQAAPAPS
ncbi:hypothetical protein OK074_7382 [Actinobacteria bacterium OK074]|nr:hypothetical protein OK074_7382 [Actinobacteria bacterium OK074]